MDPVHKLGELIHMCCLSGNTCTAVWLDGVDKLLGGIMKKHHG